MGYLEMCKNVLTVAILKVCFDKIAPSEPQEKIMLPLILCHPTHSLFVYHTFMIELY